MHGVAGQALDPIAEAYPAAVAQLLQFAMQRKQVRRDRPPLQCLLSILMTRFAVACSCCWRQSAISGLVHDVHATDVSGHEDRVHEHAAKLQKLRRAQEQKHADPELALSAKALLLAGNPKK
jgi:hypothetical protein